MNEYHISNFSQLPQPVVVRQVIYNLQDFACDVKRECYWLRIPKIADYVGTMKFVSGVYCSNMLQNNSLFQSHWSAFDNVEQVILFQNSVQNPLYQRYLDGVSYQCPH